MLQGLVALSGPRSLVLRTAVTHQAGEQLWLALDPKWDAAKADALVVKSSMRKLASAVGFKDGGRVYRIIRDSIRRLFCVTVFAQRDGQEQWITSDD